MSRLQRKSRWLIPLTRISMRTRQCCTPLLTPLGALIPVAVGIAVGHTAVAHAQTFPSKTLRIIVPFPPGGSADIMARVLAETMAKGLGQPVIVENRPGAGAVIGYELAARAPADGHTLLVAQPSFVINPLIRSRVAYDPFKDFRAVGQTISQPLAIAVHPSVPAKSLQELIALLRTRPGEFGYATPGSGVIQHIFGEMFKVGAQINLTHVPYQGCPLAMTAVAGGHVPVVICNVNEVAPFATTGKVRALVTTAAVRAETLPKVPTLREEGYAQLETANWAGLVVPAATPAAAITRLNTELVRTLRTPQVQEKLKAGEMLPLPGTPEQFAALLQSESARFTKIVQQAGIKLD
jgi:tripartite-type tricarboxylate transporter receptor subunit TctC